MSSRKISKGKCPRCDEGSYYERGSLEPDGDLIFTKCECNNCGLNFTETFELTTQEWEKADYEIKPTRTSN